MIKELFLREKKSKLVFIHIPKTAGTSLRVGLEESLDKKAVCLDYRGGSGLISDIVVEHVEQKQDLWAFKQAFDACDYQSLIGHFRAPKYASLFPLQSFACFVREPVAHIKSTYQQWRSNNKYSGSFQEFYKEPRFQNRQSLHLRGVPWQALGFVGITERYTESLVAFNRAFDLNVPFTAKNKAEQRPRQIPVDITEEDIKEIKRLNELDYSLYHAANDILDQRINLTERGMMFCNGAYKLKGNKVRGWAFNSDDDLPVELEIWDGDVLLSTVVANQYSTLLANLIAPRGGYVGFESLLPKGVSAENVSCKVKNTGQVIFKQ